MKTSLLLAALVFGSACGADAPPRFIGCTDDADCKNGPCVGGACLGKPGPGKANAGPDTEVDERGTVLLSASESVAHDPGTTYEWAVVGGSGTLPSPPVGHTVELQAPAVTKDSVIRVRLTMRDTSGHEDTDEVSVRVRNSQNEPPTVTLAASSTVVSAGEVVLFVANGGDPNPGASLSFSWSGGADLEVDENLAYFQAPQVAMDLPVSVRVDVSDGTDTAWATADVLVRAAGCDPAPCDDGEPCTLDGCTLDGCTHTPLSVPCDDGDPCTAGDTCLSGTCEGAPIDCDDGNACTADTCSEQGCAHAAVTAPCTDGDPCTTGDACVDGTCQGAPKCVGGPCTTAQCVAGSCAFAPATGPCDDGDPCTSGDACVGGACSGSPLACPGDGPCAVGACQLGSCVKVPVAGACDDGDPCTTADGCGAGACQPGVPVDCDDMDPCTDDACVAGGCVHTPSTGVACDDGDPCTAGDVCVGGSCVGEPGKCDDGDPCTAGDVCVDGTCAGEPVSCDDSDPCTVDSCVGGGCQHAPVPCDDGDPCTVDSCAGGACQHAPVMEPPCVETDPCASDAACDDGDPCTLDTCWVEPTGHSCGHVDKPLGAACLDQHGLCTTDHACRAFTVQSFDPGAVGVTEATLTGVTTGLDGIFATGSAVGPGASAGTVWRLTLDGQELVHERPEGLMDIDGLRAVGVAGAISRRDGDVWSIDADMEAMLPTQKDLLSVWEGLDGPVEAGVPAYTIGMDSMDSNASPMVSCVEGVGCTLDKWPSIPSRVVRLRGWLGTTADGLFHAAAPGVALVNDVYGWTLSVEGPAGWSTGGLGCTATESYTPCIMKFFADAVLESPTSLWLVGSGPYLRHGTKAGGWISHTPQGLPKGLKLDSLEYRALAIRDQQILVVAEVPGCGAGDCLLDPSYRSHVLFAFKEGAWQDMRVLATRQCATPQDADVCAADLLRFTVRAMEWSADGVVAVVGSDLAYSEDGTVPRMLAYLVQL